MQEQVCLTFTVEEVFLSFDKSDLLEKADWFDINCISEGDYGISAKKSVTDSEVLHLLRKLIKEAGYEPTQFSIKIEGKGYVCKGPKPKASKI